MLRPITWFVQHPVRLPSLGGIVIMGWNVSHSECSLVVLHQQVVLTIFRSYDSSLPSRLFGRGISLHHVLSTSPTLNVKPDGRKLNNGKIGMMNCTSSAAGSAWVPTGDFKATYNRYRRVRKERPTPKEIRLSANLWRPIVRAVRYLRQLFGLLVI
jgi:hypothetical protein